MRSSRRLLLLCFPLLVISSRPAWAASAAATAQAHRYDYAAYRLSTWDRDRQAIVYYTAAIKADPSDFVAYFNRAGCYLHEGEWAKALQDTDAAARLKPAYADTYYLRAAALYHMGREAECRADIARGERGKPSAVTRQGIAELRADLCQSSANPSPDEIRTSLATLDRAVAQARGAAATAEALNDRAWFLAVCRARAGRNGARAVADATEACRLTRWKQRNIIDTLAAAYAEKGEFDKAIETERKAIGMAWHDRPARTSYQRHLAAFERHQPWRITATDRE